MPRAQNWTAKGSILKEEKILCPSGYIIYLCFTLWTHRDISVWRKEKNGVKLHQLENFGQQILNPFNFTWLYFQLNQLLFVFKNMTNIAVIGLFICRGGHLRHFLHQWCVAKMLEHWRTGVCKTQKKKMQFGARFKKGPALAASCPKLYHQGNKIQDIDFTEYFFNARNHILNSTWIHSWLRS